MNIFTVILVILVVGILLWAIQEFIPLDATIRKILSAVIIIALIVWILRSVGLWHYLSRFNV